MAKASDIEHEEFKNLTHLANTTHIRKGKHYDISIFKDDKNNKIICAVSGYSSDDTTGGHSLLNNQTISLDELVDYFSGMMG